MRGKYCRFSLAWADQAVLNIKTWYHSSDASAAQRLRVSWNSFTLVADISAESKQYILLLGIIEAVEIMILRCSRPLSILYFQPSPLANLEFCCWSQSPQSNSLMQDSLFDFIHMNMDPDGTRTQVQISPKSISTSITDFELSWAQNHLVQSMQQNTNLDVRFSCEEYADHPLNSCIRILEADGPFIPQIQIQVQFSAPMPSLKCRSACEF